MSESVIDEKSIMEDMYGMLDLAKSKAMPLVSNYKVGCVVRGESGQYYLGANLEVSTNYNLHAEQAGVHNAYINGEKGITHMVVSALPCGYCRQFLYEVNPHMKIIVDGAIYILRDLLPYPFSTNDIGVEYDFFAFNKEGKFTNIVSHGSLYTNLARALLASYMSISNILDTFGGVVLRTKSGKYYVGTYIENIALNPSILPMMGAVSQLCLTGDIGDGIKNVYIHTNIAYQKANQMHIDNTMDICRYLNIPIKKIKHSDDE